jgi:hypothetical protein
LDIFSSESLSSLYEISFSAANIQRLTIENRLDEVRTRSSSINVSTVNGTIGLEKTAGDGNRCNTRMSISADSLKPAHLRRSVFHSDSEESLRSELGFRAFYRWRAGGVVLAPYLTAAWEHEFKYSALPITAGLGDIPGPNETFVGPVEGQDSTLLTAGLSVQWTPMISTYDTDFGMVKTNIGES